MKKPLLWRNLRIARLRRKIEHRGSPRLFMLLLVTITAGIAFVSSALMLRAGLHNMGWRYAAACGVAYLSFLLMLWVWLKLARWEARLSGSGDAGLDFSLHASPGAGPQSQASAVPEWRGGGGTFDGGGASANVDFGSGASGGVMPDSAVDGLGDAGAGGVSLDVGDVGDLGALALLLLIAVALLAACGALIYAAFNLVGGAPLLLSELIFDGVLAAGLYRRFRYQASRHWLETALQRTIRPFAAVLLFVSVGGFLLSFHWPQASSLGDVIRHLSM